MRSLRCRSTCKAPQRRTGTVLYMTVLGTTLVVSLLALAGLNIVRVDRLSVGVGHDRRNAREHSRSAVELALKTIELDSDWRDNHTSGAETTPIVLASDAPGTVSWIFQDTDGSLADDDTELWLKGIGRIGDTTQVSSLRLATFTPPLSTLECAVYSVGAMSQSSTSTSTSGPFASAGTLTVNGTVIGSVEGDPVNLSGGTVSGSITNPGPLREMPSVSVWDTYVPLATSIPFTDFTYVLLGSREMNRKLLGGTVNPFGDVNSQGVYHVQIPAGESLTIRNSRIHGTLLVELGANALLQLEASCLWDPFSGANYPALIVKGPATGSADVTFSGSSSALQETALLQTTVNLNPAGDPYDGVSDSDNSDDYTPLLRGLYHVIGSNVHTTLNGSLSIQGVVLCEGTTSIGQLNISPNVGVTDTPPAGYSAPSSLSVVPNSWIWDAAP